MLEKNMNKQEAIIVLDDEIYRVGRLARNAKCMAEDLMKLFDSYENATGEQAMFALYEMQQNADRVEILMNLIMQIQGIAGKLQAESEVQQSA